MKYLLAIICFLILQPISFSEPKTEEMKTIEIFYQESRCIQPDHSHNVNFYMWIKYPNADVDGPSENIYVGYDVGGYAGVYLETNQAGNMMWFVHSYKEGLSSDNRVYIKFGGSRPDDIHIYLPKNTKAKVSVSHLEK